MFSYSGRAQYRKQVLQAKNRNNPIAVVFSNNAFPATFLGRPVVDGDQSDLWNVQAGKVVVALKAKGLAKDDDSGFVVDTNLIARVAA